MDTLIVQQQQRIFTSRKPCGVSLMLRRVFVVFVNFHDRTGHTYRLGRWKLFLTFFFLAHFLTVSCFCWWLSQHQDQVGQFCEEGGNIQVVFTVLLLISFVFSCCAAHYRPTDADSAFEPLIENITQAVHQIPFFFCCLSHFHPSPVNPPALNAFKPENMYSETQGTLLRRTPWG